MKVPPAILRISAPTISGPLLIPRPIAIPVLSISAKPSWSSNDVLRGVAFFLNEVPSEIAMTN